MRYLNFKTYTFKSSASIAAGQRKDHRDGRCRVVTAHVVACTTSHSTSLFPLEFVLSSWRHFSQIAFSRVRVQNDQQLDRSIHLFNVYQCECLCYF